MNHEGKIIEMAGAPYSAYHLINEMCGFSQDMTKYEYEDEFGDADEIEWYVEVTKYGLEDFNPCKIDKVYTWSEFIYYYHVDA